MTGVLVKISQFSAMKCFVRSTRAILNPARGSCIAVKVCCRRGSGIVRLALAFAIQRWVNTNGYIESVTSMSEPSAKAEASTQYLMLVVEKVMACTGGCSTDPG